MLTSTSPAAEPPSPAAILQDLRSFDELGSVLYVAAHPDDENTQLITYLARGRGYRTAYLSVTRGDGGQNLLGPEFGAELGVIRTQELLAARHLDGGQQFFTRAMDFGFSKDYQETLRIWDRQQVVADIVRVIRTFRPDVMVTRFPPYPTGTHGHHTASAVLGVEAFKLAGDPKAFPDQLRTLTPWQPKRIFMNGGGGGRGGRGGGGGAAEAGTNMTIVRMDIGGNDPVSGESFGTIAGRSRSMHKTQGFGGFGTARGGPSTESFQLLAGAPATNGIMDGINTTWGRFEGGAAIGQLADQAIAQFDPQNPSASVPTLLAIHGKLAALPADRVIDEKRRQLDRILQACLGLTIETTVPAPEAVPGEKLKLHHEVLVRSSVPVRWVAVRYPSTGAKASVAANLKANQSASRDETQTLPANTPLTQPYWLRSKQTTGMFVVNDAPLIGQAENPPAFPIEQVFEVGGQTLVLPDQPYAAVKAGATNGIRRRLDVIPPVSLDFPQDLALLAPGATRTVSVEVTANRPGAHGELKLVTPAGWSASPAQQPFSLAATGERGKFNFTITAPKEAASGEILATAEIGGAHYDTQRIALDYPHIPFELLQPPAQLKALSLDLAIRGHAIGYVPGAGDSVADALREMGYDVTDLSHADITSDRLKSFDAVVVGVRAEEVRSNLNLEMAALKDYVKGGGVLVEQYNRTRTSQLAPYELHLSNLRVTDETAPMTFLAPDHPVLNTPNKITNADFDGWIQERGIYFPDQWDEHFTPILACNDPGEAPLKGSLLVAQDGSGYFVYTGLDFFRELPAGVPGAFRLFANLVSLGHSAPAQADGAK
jgi:LmbE family N-acetylglucosaminyl deacetylase